MAGKIESVNLKQAGVRIEKSEAGVIVVDDAFQSGDDAAKHFRKFAGGDEDVVDFQEDTEAVALKRQLFLVSLRAFEIERVIHGDGNQAGDAGRETGNGTTALAAAVGVPVVLCGPVCAVRGKAQL